MELGGHFSKEIDLVASTIVKNLRIKRGDCVSIHCGQYAIDLAEAIALRSAIRGGIPTISAMSDKYLALFYKLVPLKYIRQTPRHIIELVRNSDVYIFIEGPEDPRIEQSFSRDKVKALIEAFRLVEASINKRWCYVAWFSKKASKFYKLSFQQFKEHIINGILINYNELARRKNRVLKYLNCINSVHITDEFGTNLKLKIKDYIIVTCDGVVPKEKQKAGINMPSGEVAIIPLNFHADGNFFCPITRDYMSGNFIKDMTLKFEHEILKINKCKIGENGQLFIDTIKKFVEMDSKYYQNTNTLTIAEIGIGLNPNINKVIGYTWSTRNAPELFTWQWEITRISAEREHHTYIGTS